MGIATLVVGLGYVMIVIWDGAAFARWMSEASPVPFFLAMAVLPVIGLPLSPFLVVAGATFGVWTALIGSVVAMAITLCIGYALAHSKLRSRMVALFGRLGYDIPDFTGGGRRAWRFALAIKLAPGLPAFAKMYILAITAVPFAIYFIVSLGITTAFGIAWILLGGSLLSHDIDHVTLAAIVIAVLVVVAVVWWRRRGGVSAGAPAVA